MKFQPQIRFGQKTDPYHIEYDLRKGHFSMTVDHMHPHYELYYLFSGERLYFIKDRSYLIKPGDLVIIPNHELHKTTDTGVPDHERMVLYYDESFFKSFAEDESLLLRSPFHSNHRVLHLNIADRMRLEQLLQHILIETQNTSLGNQLSIRNAITEALLLAARHTIQQASIPCEAEALPPTAAKVTEISQYIIENYAKPLTLTHLSKTFHLSGSYLSRTFKKHTGFGLTEYIGLIRTREAQQLLRSTDKRITDIAAEVGFESLSQFERVFKTHAHLTPRQYRGQYTKK